MFTTGEGAISSPRLLSAAFLLILIHRRTSAADPEAVLVTTNSPGCTKHNIKQHYSSVESLSDTRLRSITDVSSIDCN